jgi:two-component system chemotaxis response regulator CheY
VAVNNAKTVLIIDDSVSVRRSVCHALQQAGYFVREAVDGETGIRAIEEYDDIAVILCDINMAGTDGIAVLAHFAGTKRFRRTPVIMLTSECSPDLVGRAKSLGARGWLTKPYSKEHLLMVVENAILKSAA